MKTNFFYFLLTLLLGCTSSKESNSSNYANTSLNIHSYADCFPITKGNKMSVCKLKSLHTTSWVETDSLLDELILSMNVSIENITTSDTLYFFLNNNIIYSNTFSICYEGIGCKTVLNDNFKTVIHKEMLLPKEKKDFKIKLGFVPDTKNKKVTFVVIMFNYQIAGYTKEYNVFRRKELTLEQNSKNIFIPRSDNEY